MRYLPWCVSSLLVCWLSIAAGGADWPQLQNDSRRSGYTKEAVPGPYTVKWRWHPADPTVGIAAQVQAIVAGGKVYVGAMDGAMYALDESTGQELWKYQAGGLLVGSAASDGQNLYFGAMDGNVYAISADGKLRWKRDTAGSISASPLLVDGVIYIGNRRGRFFAIDAASGQIRWQYPAAGQPRAAPFLTSAAFADGTIYIANEACTAIALGVDGSPKWTAPLKGQSVPWWPVVSSKNGVVIYRTQPVYDHTWLRESTYAVLEKLGGKHSPEGPSPGTPEQRQQEQENIRAYLNTDLFLQTFWALNTADGKEKFLAPVLYQAGGGESPVPPVVREETGEAWTSHASYFTPFDGGFFVQTGWYVDFGRIDLKTGGIDATNARKGWEEFHLVADETSFISMMGDTVLFSSWISAGSLNIKERKTAYVCFTQSTEDKSDGRQPVAEGGPWTKQTLKSAGGSGAPASVANGTIYWIGPRGLLVALATKK